MATQRNSGKRARKDSLDIRNIGKEPNTSNKSSLSFRDATPINFIQGQYLEAIKDPANSVIFGVGPAGTGKTYLSAYYAASELFNKRIEKIILTRPNIETGRSMGALPGTLDEKMYPYLAPFEDIFSKALGKGFYEYALRTKDIDARPLGFMRGSTFENCIVLVDEVQQMNKAEFQMILTRVGKNCKMILSGDPRQSDISDSGLDDAIRRLSHVDGVEVVTFIEDDIVRSKLAKAVVIAYRN